MRLLDRYIFSIFLPALGVFLGALTGLVLAVDFSSNLSKFLELKDLALLPFIGRYYLCRAPMILTVVIPAVTLFAPIFTVIKLARTNEVLPIAASGTSLRRMAAPFLAVGLLASLFMAAMEEFVLPAVADEIADTDNILLSGGKNWGVWGRDARTLLLADSFDTVKRELAEVRVTWQDADAVTHRVVKARRAVWDVERQQWRAFDGHVEWPSEKPIERPGQKPEVRRDAIPAGGLELETGISPDKLRKGRSLADQLAFGRLKDLFKEARENPENPRPRMKIHARFSFPLSPFLLLLLGLPFVVAAHSKSFVKGLIFAFLLAAGYYVLHFSFMDMGNRGVLPDAVAGWAPTGLFGLAGLVGFLRMKT